jgi:dihydroxyacetone kinase-like protein
MALAAADTIDTEQGMLSRLDAAGGDGDHGANIKAGMTAARALVERLDEPTPASVLEALQVATQEQMGGAGGVLLGEFFAGGAEVLRTVLEVDGPMLAKCLATGLERLKRTGRAEVGDRTMVDALTPAAEAAWHAASEGGDPATVLAMAAAAARQGAEATSTLVPTLGRAKYAPGRAVGTPDAGATTVALILEAFAGAAEEAR